MVQHPEITHFFFSLVPGVIFSPIFHYYEKETEFFINLAGNDRKKSPTNFCYYMVIILLFCARKINTKIF